MGALNFVYDFADVILAAKKPERIELLGQTYKITPGTKFSINNQSGNLRDANLLGRDMEFTITGNGLNMPLVFQLYDNSREHFRLFLFNNKGMLFSVNLTTGYNSSFINLEQLIRYSSRKLTEEQRVKASCDTIAILASENIRIHKGKIAWFGTFDTLNQQFVDTTPERFLEEMIKVGLIKGHYSQNKGYSIANLL